MEKIRLFNPSKTVLNGLFIPNFIYLHPKLSPLAKIVYGELLSLMKEDGYVVVTQKTLVDDCISNTTDIKKSIRELEKANLVGVKGDTYWFIEPPIKEEL